MLLGITEGDGEKDIDYICGKLVNMRIFRDDNDKMNLSIADVDGEMLVVSQFTLYGDVRNGRRPDYATAATGETAKPLYEQAVEKLKTLYKREKIKTGIFAADMKVSILNDGPVTILLDSHKNF